MKQILDIYSDNRVDFDQEVATGTDGVLIKGGQGHYQQYRVKKCNFIDQAKDHALPWGIFWQMDARYSPEGCKAAIKDSFPTGDFGPLGLWMACEFPYYSKIIERLYWTFPYAGYKKLEESVWRGMFNSFGFYPGIYTSISKWNVIFKDCPIGLQQEFAARSRLWVAQYKIAAPDKIGAWVDYTLWQYTENPDYSVVHPNAEGWFNQVTGGSVTPPEVPNPIPPPGEQHLVSQRILQVNVDTIDPNARVEARLI